jgi:hypothetical protein
MNKAIILAIFFICACKGSTNEKIMNKNIHVILEDIIIHKISPPHRDYCSFTTIKFNIKFINNSLDTFHFVEKNYGNACDAFFQPQKFHNGIVFFEKESLIDSLFIIDVDNSYRTLLPDSSIKVSFSTRPDYLFKHSLREIELFYNTMLYDSCKIVLNNFIKNKNIYIINSKNVNIKFILDDVLILRQDTQHMNKYSSGFFNKY